MFLIDTIVGGITGLAGKYFDNKKEKQAATHTQKMSVIQNRTNWETVSLKGMAASLKDEYWTLIFSVPLVAIFISPFVDLFMSDLPYQTGSLMTAGHAALTGLTGVPTWYTYILGMMIGASFGVKGAGEIMNKLRGKK